VRSSISLIKPTTSITTNKGSECITDDECSYDCSTIDIVSANDREEENCKNEEKEMMTGANERGK